MQYAFTGFPLLDHAEPLVHAMFKDAAQTWRFSFQYLGGTDTDCMYSFSSYLETRQGKGVLFTGHGYLEFNEEGKIIKHVAYSNDTQPLAEAFQELM